MPRRRRRSPSTRCPKLLRRPDRLTRDACVHRSGRDVWSGFRPGMCEGAWQQPSSSALGTLIQSTIAKTVPWPASDRGINRQRAIDRLFRLFPRDRKRLCCRGLDPRRSSHFAPRFLICLKIRIAGSPSRTIFARLRSLAGNIIALTTAERSFIVP